QAEDGIRDFHVTGVQTCALPILSKLSLSDTRCLAWYDSAGSSSKMRGSSLGRLSLPVQVSSSFCLPLILVPLAAAPVFAGRAREIGRASCRERVESAVVA